MRQIVQRIDDLLACRVQVGQARRGGIGIAGGVCLQGLVCCGVNACVRGGKRLVGRMRPDVRVVDGLVPFAEARGGAMRSPGGCKS